MTYEGHWIPANFLGLPNGLSNRVSARFIVLPVPYDSTTSYKGGARHGPQAIIGASYNLEEYDADLDLDVSKLGIHTCPSLEPHFGGPQLMVERVYSTVKSLMDSERLVVMLGGEHSLTSGSVRAHKEVYPDLSVLYLDAHADLRDQYMGTGWGHASAARRIFQLCPLVQVGVRSLSLPEKEFIEKEMVRTYYWPAEEDMESLVRSILGDLSPNVYVTVDLDVLDSSIMSAVGTPEPGGMGWRNLTFLLKRVAEEKCIVGCDIMELSPDEGPTACTFTAAKLAYRLMGCSELKKK